MFVYFYSLDFRSILAFFVSLVLLATLFDFYKRYRFEQKYSQLISLNAAVSEHIDGVIPEAVEPDTQSTSHSETKFKDFDKLYLAKLEGIVITILISSELSLRTLYSISYNSIKCLSQIIYYIVLSQF